MRKLLITFLFFIFVLPNYSFSKSKIDDFKKIDLSKDQKPGRFFEDQPDVTDEHQIHFIYLLPSDGEDRELDINGKMQDILEKANEAMLMSLQKLTKVLEELVKNTDMIIEKMEN